MTSVVIACALHFVQEDIRAALMNFGSGSIEATRPQHEVFASEDKVVHLNGASNSSASSAAAEAWMAAAMHATQMQPSNSHCSMDQTCGRQAADPMAQGGMNSWWRSSSGLSALPETSTLGTRPSGSL